MVRSFSEAAHLANSSSLKKTQVIFCSGRQRFWLESEQRKRSQKRKARRIHLRKFQTAAAKEFTRLLPLAVGGDYFCGPSYTGSNQCGELSFTIQKPTPLDKGIIDGLEAKQRAELAKQAQEQKNEQVNVELRSVKSQVALLGPNGYLLKTAIESGNDSGP